MNIEQTSPEFQAIFNKMVINPQEYLDGKVCDLTMLSNIDNSFLMNIEKDYMSDYFFIKDWLHFSFYNGNFLKKVIKNDFFSIIPIKNLKLIWNAFNENKIEKNGKESKYYHYKRCEEIPKIIFLLIKNSKHYNSNDVLDFLQDLMQNLKEEIDEKYFARQCALFLGQYVSSNKTFNNEIFDYLKQKQNFTFLDFQSIFYCLKIDHIIRKDNFNKVLDFIDEKKPNFDISLLFGLCLKNNSFSTIMYINERYDLSLNEEDINDFLTKQKYLKNLKEITFFIENFKPLPLIKICFENLFSDYKFKQYTDQKKYDFYYENLKNIDTLILYQKIDDKLKYKIYKENIKKNKI